MDVSANGRKRKLGIATKPCDDYINSSTKASCRSQKNLLLEFDDYTSSEDEEGQRNESIKVLFFYCHLFFFLC